MKKPIVRIAPTPSGFLHQGNLYNFILTWLFARQNGGEIHLRIDDIDGERIRDCYLEDIFSVLKWLKLDYDHGPQTADEFLNHFSQRKKVKQYIGNLASNIRSPFYVCSCSRAQIKELKGQGKLRCECHRQQLKLTTGENLLRVMVPDNWMLRSQMEVDLVDAMGDFVVIRRDGIPSYQLVSLHEDINMGITHIIRGDDLLPSTAAQQFLARQLKLDRFLDISCYHHSLLVDDNGNKFSKSSGAQARSILEEQQNGPANIIQLFCQTKGWQLKGVHCLNELLAKAPPVVLPVKTN